MTDDTQVLTKEQFEAAQELAGQKDVPLSEDEYEDLLQILESEETDEQETAITEPRAELTKQKDGNYRIDDKVLVIKYMEAFQRPYGFEDEMVPQYRQIARLFKLNPGLLYTWWQDRDAIMAKFHKWQESIPTMMQARLSVEMMRMLDHMTTIDYKEVGLGNFISLLQLTMQMHRLYSGQSTSNVSQKSEHKVIHVAPDTAQEGNLPRND